MLIKLSQRLWNSSFAWGSAVLVLRIAGFLLVMAYALRLLPPEEIGLWYVMMNIAGLAVAVDFGFSAVIARHASYCLSGVAQVPEIGLLETGGTGRLDTAAFAGLIRMAQRLYRWLALIMGVGMLATWVVWVAFMESVRHRPIPWPASLAFVILTAGSVYGMTGLFWPHLLFGLNKVKRYQQLTLLGLIANYGLAGIGLRFGWGLLALCLGQIAFILLPRLLAQRSVLSVLTATDFKNSRRMRWRQLWPMTWRSGALGVCAFLLIQNLTFVCSWVTDLKTTASFGLTLQMALMLYGLASLWVLVKQPEIVMARAAGNRAQVVSLFRRRLFLCTATYVAGVLFLMVAAPTLLVWVGAKTSVLPPLLMLWLLLFIGAEMLVGVHSAILQTGNETPHLPAVISSACLALLLFWPMGKRWGLPGILGAAFLGQLAINYWRTPWQCWKRLLNRSAQEAQ